MNTKVQEKKAEIKVYPNAISDCSHLIDLPATNHQFFINKSEGNTSIKPEIRVLSIFHPKNGLSKLL
ncbi:hypothetical protein ACFOG5_04995 [Pedobacter fastidiosus]|uniref:Uncharacterized protein n=1 Tax=Pedobacter fastidiosus TaxID=2765361 RepID=A0ABR7KQY5_9SPHI|nr:hypothetical protein [Pedobacter fastidiosus]MBC6110496.1 hypothetical protein [Pedobacter fastidiosus]